MSTYSSVAEAEAAIRQNPPTTVSQAGQTASVTHVIDIDTSADFSAANDKLLLGVLPAGHVLVDAVLFCEDLDTGAGLVIDVGKDTANGKDDIIDGSTIGQGGGVARLSSALALLDEGEWVVDRENDTEIFAFAQVPPAGDQDGKIGLTLTYAPAGRP